MFGALLPQGHERASASRDAMGRPPHAPLPSGYRRQASCEGVREVSPVKAESCPFSKTSYFDGRNTLSIKMMEYIVAAFLHEPFGRAGGAADAYGADALCPFHLYF